MLLLGENDIGLSIIFSEYLIGDGQEMSEHAGKLNFEGIVSKNAQAPYRSDRNEGWRKLKPSKKEKVPVIGFVKDPTGARYSCGLWSGGRALPFVGLMNPKCVYCKGLGWVCENHPHLAWSDEFGCQCGAGMPCECNRADEPDVSQVIGEAPTKH